jgi:hypothetical protein
MKTIEISYGCHEKGFPGVIFKKIRPQTLPLFWLPGPGWQIKVRLVLIDRFG